MEVWKDIQGYEGLYQSSNLGRIRSVDRLVEQYGHKRNYTRLIKGKIIKPKTQNCGYLLVWLSKNGITTALLVHRLVASSFLKTSNNLMDVNHINGNKQDNRIENLEYCQRSENIKHSYNVLKRKKSGVKKVFCMELGLTFDSISEAAIKLSINPDCITHVLHGRNKTAGGYKWHYL